MNVKIWEKPVKQVLKIKRFKSTHWQRPTSESGCCKILKISNECENLRKTSKTSFKKSKDSSPLTDKDSHERVGAASG